MLNRLSLQIWNAYYLFPLEMINVGSHEWHWRWSTHYLFRISIEWIRNIPHINVIYVKCILKNGFMHYLRCNWLSFLPCTNAIPTSCAVCGVTRVLLNVPITDYFVSSDKLGWGFGGHFDSPILKYRSCNDYKWPWGIDMFQDYIFTCACTCTYKFMTDTLHYKTFKERLHHRLAGIRKCEH